MIVKEFNIESSTYFGIECDKKVFSKKSQFQKIDVYYSKFFGNILDKDCRTELFNFKEKKLIEFY